MKLLLPAIFIFSILFATAQNDRKKPNIIFFLVDDMGWQETSVPFWKEKTMLNERYQTPAMETLAASGMKFTQAYACPLCSPTRVSLMTGINAARHEVTNWTLRKNVSPDNKHNTLEIPEWNVNGLSPVAGIENTFVSKTLPMYLQEAGYKNWAEWPVEKRPLPHDNHFKITEALRTAVQELSENPTVT